METALVDRQVYPTAVQPRSPSRSRLAMPSWVPQVTDRYCVKGSNPGSSEVGGAGSFYWYDSKLGGLQSAATAAPPLAGLCATGSLTFTATT